MIDKQRRQDDILPEDESLLSYGDEMDVQEAAFDDDDDFVEDLDDEDD